MRFKKIGKWVLLGGIGFMKWCWADCAFQGRDPPRAQQASDVDPESFTSTIYR